MKLATRRNGAADGELLVVSRDRAFACRALARRSLREALEGWSDCEADLRAQSDRLNAGGEPDAFRLDLSSLAAPLPRTWQWLDGSAFLSHTRLMEAAYGLEPLPTGAPLMYQGLSHQFLGATEDMPLPDEADGIDFEGELAVITDTVAMGVRAENALGHVKLIALVNDWSLREVGRSEMKTGFGWVQAKPACSLAPIVVTPDELGASWAGGRVDATFRVWRGEEPFGAAPTDEMAFGFAELIAHAARTRVLASGTLIGSGTVSTAAYRQQGSCCIAEKRAAEMLEHGEAHTSYLHFGERIRMELELAGGETPFGCIDQRVVAAS